MRILFVAMPNSVHTVRWIGQLAEQGYDLYLFPSTDAQVHPGLDKVKVSLTGRGLRFMARMTRALLRRSGLEKRVRSGALRSVMERSFWLAYVIRHIKPNVIHSLEIQHAGYLTLAARERLGRKFPAWIVTNWGSDIYLFGRLASHVDQIKKVLAACDYYSCECQRDVQLAKNLGLQGAVLAVVPNTGGFDVARVARYREPGATASRRLIVLKGYQNWAGRALIGLRAMELCADALRGYRIAIYSATYDVEIAAELVAQATGIPIDIVPRCSHEEMLRLFGRARVYIGLSISDAISTSLLEAMVMGTFPIQSCTACADEWIEDGKTGLIVPPEDPEVVAEAIRRAVSDDALVDEATERNARVAAERLDYSVVQAQVIAMYEKVAAQGGTN